MKSTSENLAFFLNFTKIQSVITRKFDSQTGNLTEFIILLALSEAEGEKMRRIDLAKAVGLTASGVTRLLLPMEKIGLVGRESHPTDARASYVTLAPGGKRQLEEHLVRAENLADELFIMLRGFGWKKTETELMDKLGMLARMLV